MAGFLLSQSNSLTVASGIANIYARDAVTASQGYDSLNQFYPSRFLLGLGVSHVPLVEGARGHQYGKPVATMQNYLKNIPPKKETISPNVLKGPKDISQYLENHQPTEWIIDSFGARGSCDLLAGETGSGKTSFIYQMAYAISTGDIFLGELTTQKLSLIHISEPTRPY